MTFTDLLDEYLKRKRLYLNNDDGWNIGDHEYEQAKQKLNEYMEGLRK